MFDGWSAQCWRFYIGSPAPVRQTDWLAALPRCQRRGLLASCPTADPSRSTSDTRAPHYTRSPKSRQIKQQSRSQSSPGGPRASPCQVLPQGGCRPVGPAGLLPACSAAANWIIMREEGDQSWLNMDAGSGWESVRSARTHGLAHVRQAEPGAGVEPDRGPPPPPVQRPISAAQEAEPVCNDMLKRIRLRRAHPRT